MNIQFYHGLGDAVQLSIVLKHLPVNTYVKTHNHLQALFPLPINPDTNTIYPFWEEGYENSLSKPESLKKLLFSGGIWEPQWKHLPPTKVTRCLTREFQIVPDPTLYQYELPVFDNELANDFLADKGNYMLIHANGITSRTRKDLTDDEIYYFIELVKSQGFTPILLDFYNYLTHIDCERTNIPFSVEALGTLLIKAKRLIGIDSGPEHMSLAYGTPTTIVWKEWCPFHNIDPHPWLDNWITNDVFKHFIPMDGRLSNKIESTLHKYNISFYRSIRDVNFEIFD